MTTSHCFFPQAIFHVRRPISWIGKLVCPLFLFVLSVLSPVLAAGDIPVSVKVASSNNAADLSPRFLGFSYEMPMLLPENGKYNFDPADTALVNTFKTLGIKSVRVGANGVDDPRAAIPQEKDIDVFFNFARAAGVKVIYSFRLKHGDPANSARLAAYIMAHDADALDCFTVGNEPSFYFPTFAAYFAQWKLHYDAILQVAPDAKFDGPSVAGKNIWAVDLAQAVFPAGHLKLASDHWYFFGSGRDGEKDPAQTRDRFLSDDVHKTYESAYKHIAGVLAAEGVPYRLDEMNSCYGGGAKDSSDTYASALWALDCTHWWAAHHIDGVNFHNGHYFNKEMGESIGFYYAAFVPDGNGYAMRPMAYANLAFTQGAHGQPMEVTVQTAPKFNFDAYGYRDLDGSLYVTLINKSYGATAQPASVALQVPDDTGPGSWQRMDLVEKDSDVAAKTGLTLGGASIDTQGNWAGQWEKADGADGNLKIQVAPASATILRFSPTK